MNTFWNKIFFAGATAILASAMVSCDNISEDNRFVEVQAVETKRVVLIEDFTGQNCVNCPDAHKALDGLLNQYGDAIVAVSIHGGPLSINKQSTSFEYNYIGLGNEVGDYYIVDKFGIQDLPAGMINRNGNIYKYDDWAGIVRSELERPSDMDMELSAQLVDNPNAEANQSVNIDVTVLPNANITGDLQVWVLESGIVARQTTSTGRDNAYVHNHVLRADVNGLEGEAVSLTRDEPFTASYTIDVRYNDQERWNPENLSVVAFVKAADGVHQVVQTKVK